LRELGINPVETADAIEEALLAEAGGTLWTAPKAGIVPGDGRYSMSTLAIGGARPLMVTKSVLVQPENRNRGLPTINGLIMVQHGTTGLPLAVLDANWITAWRTPALSLVAARRMANPAAKRITFLGCGVQARAHLKTFAAAFPLGEVIAFGRGQENIERLCSTAKALGMSTMSTKDPREAVSSSDIVVSAITVDFEMEPFIDPRWLKPGAFAAITDVARPWIRDGIYALGHIIIDDLAQERAMGGAMVPLESVTGDLQGLIAGKVEASHRPDSTSAFIFRGMAIGDFALTALAMDRAGI